MNINEWIKEYAEDNDIEIPDGIGDVNSTINFLRLKSSGSGGGSNNGIYVAEYDPETMIMNITWAEAFEMIGSGILIGIPYKDIENNYSSCMICNIAHEDEQHYFLIGDIGQGFAGAESPDDYLTFFD